MAKRNVAGHPKNEESTEILPKIKPPLVFISHDTRDAGIAEEFGNLLKSASAGALKSFRSSDKKPTQGIEYGSEWYPAIMEKIDEATDVVCLLTQHSIDRPWILYEAGVAKGKLDTKVVGLALGISLSVAIKGPFAQFQNLDDDQASLTKLILELVKKIPGLDPDEQNVKTLVETFKEKTAQIISTTTNTTTAPPKKDSVAETSVAKLFEEVKIMFDDLPSRIEKRVDPESRGRKLKFNPMMMEGIFHVAKGFSNSHTSILIILSFYKNDFPWIYEIGCETLKAIRSRKPINEKHNAVRAFLEVFEFSFRHPMMRETMSNQKDFHMMFRETHHIFEDHFRRYISENKDGDQLPDV